MSKLSEIRAATAPMLILLFTVLMTPVAWSVPLTNGDFSNGLAGWNTSGDVTADASVALLRTGVGAATFSAVLTQGDDGSFTFSQPLTIGPSDMFLLFDVGFFELGVDVNESDTSFFRDHLDVTIYDMLDDSLDLFFGTVANFNNTMTQQISLDVSSLAGRNVALEFALFDENDGLDSSAVIDNVNFGQATAVPAPSAVMLLVTGVLAVRRRPPK